MHASVHSGCSRVGIDQFARRPQCGSGHQRGRLLRFGSAAISCTRSGNYAAQTGPRGVISVTYTKPRQAAAAPSRALRPGWGEIAQERQARCQSAGVASEAGTARRASASRI